MSAPPRLPPALGRLRLPQRLRGAVSNLVKVKPSADDPEAPMPGARVRLHRLVDGVCDWRGVSAADGSYSASGLRAGLSYVPVAVDLSETYECVASGPVLAAPATRAAPVARVIIGRPYAAELRVFDPAYPITSISVSGTLPTDLSRDGLNLFGDWPTGTPGSYPITLTIGQGGASTEVPIELALVLLPLVLTASASPVDAVSGQAIAPVSFSAVGGEGPYSYSIVDGVLPTGLSYSADEHKITGTASEIGGFSITVRAVDARSTSAALVCQINVRRTAPKKWWRVAITKNHGYTGTQIMTLELRAASGKPNQAIGGSPGTSASASSTYTTYVAENAFDDNAATAWFTSTAPSVSVPQWIAFMAAAPIEVNQIAMICTSVGGEASISVKDFVVQSSTDGTTWADEWSVTDTPSWATGEMRVFDRP